jgi:hypothetical protein
MQRYSSWCAARPVLRRYDSETSDIDIGHVSGDVLLTLKKHAPPNPKNKIAPHRSARQLNGGADETRTRDLLRDRQAF